MLTKGNGGREGGGEGKKEREREREREREQQKIHARNILCLLHPGQLHV